MFKTFCRRNAAVSDLYDSKSKNKIAVVFFPNSHGCIIFICVKKTTRAEKNFSKVFQKKMCF